MKTRKFVGHPSPIVLHVPTWKKRGLTEEKIFEAQSILNEQGHEPFNEYLQQNGIYLT